MKGIVTADGALQLTPEACRQPRLTSNCQSARATALQVDIFDSSLIVSIGHRADWERIDGASGQLIFLSEF